jgi:3-ketosteroid 9alpha-monooxygenase subunit B
MPREHHYHPLTVADVIDETADTRSFVLEIPPALEGAFAYAAGQFCTFRAEIGGEPIVRCYSMSSSPDTGDRFTVTVKRVPGGKMSNWMNDTLAPGDTIDVIPPTGLFVLRAAATPIMAFAGGSGITPVLSIVKTALVTTAREIVLVYANRGPRSVIFAAALERLRAGSGGRLSVHHHLDSEKGFLDAAACAALVEDRTQADFYICGPGPYMEVVEAGLDRRGVEAGRRFIERFELPDEAPAASEASETESIVIRARRHHPRRRPTCRPQAAVRVRVGKLWDLHGLPWRRQGHDAGKQCSGRRRGRGGLGPDLPGCPYKPRGRRRLRSLTDHLARTITARE